MFSETFEEISSRDQDPTQQLFVLSRVILFPTLACFLRDAHSAKTCRLSIFICTYVLKPGFHWRRKRKDNSSYFSMTKASTQAKAQAHCILMLVLVLAASTRIKICLFCVIALVLASLVKTRLNSLHLSWYFSNCSLL